MHEVVAQLPMKKVNSDATQSIGFLSPNDFQQSIMMFNGNTS
ncbi:Uncharacterized protein APZ42_032113 [Daphnia magna]|uniref:Uncharacterized protein n=1 Tax=Daphnia magna TaxID=35525 RepID=A0A164M9F4_9CRUS|nr:Uncharacterized protein APZ42_032113 [Daphnia magna]